MKKALVTVLVAVVAVVMLFACAKGYESQKSVNDLTVTLSVERYPLVKGDNALTVRIVAAGKDVTDATVSVRYFMPPMPGMAPMEFNTQAMLKGSAYAFSANVPMEGGWKAEVSVLRPGQPAATVLFNLDAR